MRQAVSLAIALVTFVVAARAEEPTARKFSCLVIEQHGEIRQLWAFPDREGIDVQKIADKHLPFDYIHDLDLLVRLPRNARTLHLTMEGIADLRHLRTIDLSGTSVTDDELRGLVGCRSLEVLVVDATEITDAGLENLSKCECLRFLSVHETKVTNRGIAGVQRLIPALVVATGNGETAIPWVR